MKRSISLLVYLAFTLTTACSLAGLNAAPTPSALPQLTIIPPSITPTTEPTAATPTPEITPTQALESEQFDLTLGQAFENHDFDTLRLLMKDRFSISTFNINLLEFPADEAIDKLKATVLAEGSEPVPAFQTDIVRLLKGADPLALWGPVASPIRAIHMTGLGPNADEEAVLVIGRDAANGDLYWHGILLPEAGAFSNLVPGPDEVQTTGVTSILALEDIYIRIGPGKQYKDFGLLHQGQTAQVTGKSLDGLWWRINCIEIESHLCWVSADPTLTEPAPAP